MLTSKNRLFQSKDCTNKMMKTALNCNKTYINKYLRNLCTRSDDLSISNVFKNKKIGDSIKVQGWIKSLRKMKDNVFIDVSDGSCSKHLQIIVPMSSKPEKLSTESSITVSGILNSSPKGDIELHADMVQIAGECNLSEGYPFLPRKSYPPDYVRQYLHMRSRTKSFSALLRVRHNAMFAIHEYLDSQGFYNINTPILTGNDCEGAGEVFTIVPEKKAILEEMKKGGVNFEDSYFDKKVFLSVSGQLHLEAVTHGLSKVYTFGPTFRAENSKSRLHLSEFYMLEVEKAFVTRLEDVAEEIEKLIIKVSEVLIGKCGVDIDRCNSEEKKDFGWVSKKFPVLQYEDAVEILRKNKDKLKIPFKHAYGLTKEHELFLVRHCGNVPTFVINFPKVQKPFYMKECVEDPSKAAALDLLVPNVGEIVGGSLREDNYEKLQEKLPSKNLDWYLELRKFGGVSTGGFGLGFERYLQFLTGISNIKDTLPFPRWPHNCSM